MISWEVNNRRVRGKLNLILSFDCDLRDAFVMLRSQHERTVRLRTKSSSPGRHFFRDHLGGQLNCPRWKTSETSEKVWVYCIVSPTPKAWWTTSVSLQSPGHLLLEMLLTSVSGIKRTLQNGLPRHSTSAEGCKAPATIGWASTKNGQFVSFDPWRVTALYPDWLEGMVSQSIRNV